MCNSFFTHYVGMNLQLPMYFTYHLRTLQYIIGHSKLLHDQVNTKFLNGGNVYDTFTHVFWKIMVYYIYRACYYFLDITYRENIVRLARDYFYNKYTYAQYLGGYEVWVLKYSQNKIRRPKILVHPFHSSIRLYQ